MALKQVNVNKLSEPQREKLLKVLRDCSNSMTRMEAEKDFVKETVNVVSKEMELPKKLTNRLLKVYHKQNFDEEVAVHEQFETIYQNVVK